MKQLYIRSVLYTRQKRNHFVSRNDIQIVYAEKLHILIYVKFPHRQLLFPDGALMLPVIPDDEVIRQINQERIQ